MNKSNSKVHTSKSRHAIWQEQQAATERTQNMFARWKELERILGILRPISPHPEAITSDRMSAWYAAAARHEFTMPTRCTTACEWFHVRFPEVAQRYGPAMLELRRRGAVPGAGDVTVPVFPNTDFLGAMLAGEPALGHQIVFTTTENTFYYLDPNEDAYFPVSEPKLQLLASNYLIQAAQACSNSVDSRPLLDDFRKASVLREITTKARSILEADPSFFTGQHGKERIVDGHRINPTDEPAHRLFVKNLVARQPGARIPISALHARYVDFCRECRLPMLAASVFKKTVPDVIEEHFGARLRHDVSDEFGKQQHGWSGLALLN